MTDARTTSLCHYNCFTETESRLKPRPEFSTERLRVRDRASGRIATGLLDWPAGEHILQRGTNTPAFEPTQGPRMVLTIHAITLSWLFVKRIGPL